LPNRIRFRKSPLFDPGQRAFYVPEVNLDSEDFKDSEDGQFFNP
jgi:hypothetical protein